MNSFNYNYTNNEISDTVNEFDYKTWVNGGGIREIDNISQRPAVPECNGIFYVTRDTNKTYWYNPTSKTWKEMGSGGGPGGSVNWGEIGGNIDSQADLKLKLDKIETKENLVYHQDTEPTTAVKGDLWVTDDNAVGITNVLISKNNGRTYSSVVDDNGTAKINLTETFNQEEEPDAVEGDVWVTQE